LENSPDNIFRGLNVESFFVKPVQRLPKYVLLLKELVKHTSPDDSEYALLDEALI